MLQSSHEVVCRFPDGYSAEETLVLLQLAWSLGSPAIAAHCGSRISQMAAGSIVSLADFDVQSWRWAAEDMATLAAFHPEIRAAFRKGLMPLASLTDDDVKVLLKAEALLFKHFINRQHASAMVHQTSDPGTALATAFVGNQNSQSQRNLSEVTSIVAHQADGARTMRETLETNNQHQLQNKHSQGKTLTGFTLRSISRMPKLGTHASLGKQNSHSSSKQAPVH